MTAADIIGWAFIVAGAVFAAWSVVTMLKGRKLHARGLTIHGEVQDARATRFAITAIGMAALSLMFGLVA
ncbi:hypothetical protein [Demequina globuliformis]|uniref:hypothetical protein n=1 Tax=Demequina globuliformis TaxID=676202 RepID=UPI00078600DF|nr:hypothetical protein [Demequina globuliformis]